MILFNSDYLEGAHPKILEKMSETNFEQTPGYGEDIYCDQAREKITQLCEMDTAEVHFLTGGTQANLTVISALLRPHQGVITAQSGHINIHESGAIEATGHKVLSLPSNDGKLTARQILDCYEAHWNDETHEHIVQPGMVYISHPSEIGTLYTKAELTAISEVSRKCGLILFLDGARLGYGLMAKGADLTLPDFARLCDVFYIGGTKVGALLGEAVVITKDELKKDFRYLIKQRGGRLAKGRILGIQFLTLFEDELYFEIARHAIDMADSIRLACLNKGFPMLGESTTNQQFPIMPDDAIKKLEKKYTFSYWERIDDTHSAVRICTSWATRKEDVEALIEDIMAL